MPRMMGADNPAYRGGVTHLRTLIRNSKMYKDWKEIVYQKDRYKCCHCGMFGDRRSLEVHHVDREFADILQDFIKKYEDKYELPRDEQKLLMLAEVYAPFWVVKNGISLCKQCHKDHHRKEREMLKNADTIH